MRRRFPQHGLGTVAGVLLLLAVQAPAQIIWSGNVDIAHKVDILQDANEEEARINRSLKGLSPFNLTRARLFADAELTDNAAVLTTVLWDSGLGHFDMEGAYVLFSELGGRPALNLQVGRMATPFGRFAARTYATVNPLIGTPLIYQYFSSARGNAVPANVQQQLAWASTGGAAYQVRGLPTIYDACWNTGIQLFGATRRLAYAVAATKGALSNPQASSNEGVQWVGRIGLQPTIAWQLGLSAAWGPYLEASARQSPGFPAGRSVEDFRQLLLGVDTSISAGRWEITGEGVLNSWDVPNLEPGDDALRNAGGYLEAMLDVRPGWKATARLGHIYYFEIDNGAGSQVAWDWAVTRLEAGVEHYLDHNLRVKAVVQFNWRDGAPDDADHMVGTQLATAF
jgi:hypothetical protein